MQHAFIYKILTGPQWQDFQAKGLFEGAPVDLADGYIHFSTWDQVAETADKHFSVEDEIILAKISIVALPAELTWEPSRGGALFPHLYDRLPMSAVVAHRRIACSPGGGASGLFPLPSELAPNGNLNAVQPT